MTLILGRKRGMTQLFAADGTVTGVTVVEAGPCVVTQVKTTAREGYDAIQIAFEDVTDKRVAKPQVGHFQKAGVGSKRFLREDRLGVAPSGAAPSSAAPSSAAPSGAASSSAAPRSAAPRNGSGAPQAGEAKKVGDTLTCDVFQVGDIVDVIGTSKGRGFAGTIKRHGFSRGPETHGCMNVRQPGSLASKRIGKVVKGKRLGGHMGDERCTSKNLAVIKVDKERNLLYLRGSVAGPPNGFVQVQTAKTGYRTKKAGA